MSANMPQARSQLVLPIKNFKLNFKNAYFASCVLLGLIFACKLEHDD